MKILLVEDLSGQARLIHKIILNDDAHEILICKDAFEAFAALRAISGIDVVFLDNDLPYVQGMDLLQKIRDTKDLANLKVVMSTADEEYDSFKTLGADDCIHKPFNKDELYRVLNEYKK
ncbi:MAG: response regulator [Lentisphaeraceae bacterium]|nr:response regulator [Lentisphaeraceae bacterium]